MADINDIIRMIYLQQSLQRNQALNQQKKLSSQLSLYESISSEKTKQADELMNLSNTLQGQDDLTSVRDSLEQLKIGVGNHDDLMSIYQAKIDVKKAHLDTADAIRNKLTELDNSIESPGGIKILEDLENQISSISESLTEDSEKVLDDDIQRIRKETQTKIRMSFYDTDPTTSKIDIPQAFGHGGGPLVNIDPNTGKPTELRFVSPEREAFLEKTIQDEYSYARQSDDWEPLYKMLKEMPELLRKEGMTAAKVLAKDQASEATAKGVRGMDRVIGGYKASLDEIMSDFNPVGKPKFETGQAEGLTDQEKKVMSTLPDAEKYANRNSEKTLTSYDAEGLLARVEEALVETLDSQASDEAKLSFETSMNEFMDPQGVGNLSPLDKDRRKVVDNILSASRNPNTKEYAINEDLINMKLKWGEFFSGDMTVPDQGDAFDYRAVNKLIKLRESIIKDIEAGLFDPFEDALDPTNPTQPGTRVSPMGNRKTGGKG